MKKFRFIKLGCFTFLLFTLSCNVAEDRDDCPPNIIGENKKIIIDFDWSMVDKPDDGELIEVSVINHEKGTVQVLTIDVDGTEVELEPELYCFVGDENHPNVILESDTVTVASDANRTFYQPVYFAGGSIDQEIVITNETQRVTIPMRQQTRPLIIEVILRGEGIAYLENVNGNISGITMSRHINDGFPPIDYNSDCSALFTGIVDYNFSEYGVNIFRDQKTLLGIDDDQSQTVNLNIVFTDGSEKTLIADVTGEIEDFHTRNIKEPWLLQFILYLGPLGFEATIEDWYSGAESELIAQ